MRRLLEWLLGLDADSLSGDGSLGIRFITPPAPWIMLIGAVVTAVFVVSIHRHEAIKRRWKWAVILLRFGAVMTVLFVLSQPMIVLRRTHIERGQVAVLIDTSVSMSTHDGDWSGPDATRDESGQSTRIEAALRTLDTNRGALHESISRYDVSYWAFSEGVTRLNAPTLQGLAPVADGRRTDMASALMDVLDAIQSARLASVIVISDGRQTTNTQLDTVLAQASARRIPVHTIGVGSWQPVKDVGIDSVWHDDDVFIQDSVTLRVQMNVRGIESSTDTLLELKDATSGTLLSSYQGRLETGSHHIAWDLQYRPAEVGRRALDVIVRSLPGEMDVTNNVAQVSIRSHDEKIRVLYVEGLPRYEYRFLKNLLVREPTIESSCLLLSATAGFAQEGTLAVRKFPASLDELSGYDVVLLGDIDFRREEWISRTQQEWLVEFVSNLGGGVGVIAGPEHVPHVLRQTALEKLLPVVLDSQWSPRADETWRESFQPQITDEGEQSGLFQFGIDRATNRQIAERLSGWYYFARVLTAQPGASVLVNHPVATSAGGAMPMVVVGRFGAGRTLYVGSDDVWRWREYDGDRYYESFWLGAIRTLARGRKFGVDRPWTLETDRKCYEVGEPVRVRLTVRDPSARAALDDVVVTLNDSTGPIDRLTLHPERTTEGFWEGSCRAEAVGVLTLAASGGPTAAAAEPITTVIEVKQVDAELREPSADRDALRRIADQTGGRAVWMTDRLNELGGSIPDRSHETPDDLETPLWDTRLIVMMMTLLLTGEWMIRRAQGLP